LEHVGIYWSTQREETKHDVMAPATNGNDTCHTIEVVALINHSIGSRIKNAGTLAARRKLSLTKHFILLSRPHFAKLLKIMQYYFHREAKVKLSTIFVAR